MVLLHYGRRRALVGHRPPPKITDKIPPLACVGVFIQIKGFLGGRGFVTRGGGGGL